MEYQNIIQAIFLKRTNRFIAHCIINKKIVIAHVKNTGRCKELLIKGAKVYLEYSPSPSRKTDYSLIAVKKDNNLINIDSQAPNKITIEAIEKRNIHLPNLQGKITKLEKEKTYENSRLDIYIETSLGEKAFIEVKGVTLEKDNIAMFPDAPTKRGSKHIQTLIKANQNGYKTYIIFIIQMKQIKYFTPNKNTDQIFYELLKKAKENKIEIIAYDCIVHKNKIEISKPINIRI